MFSRFYFAFLVKRSDVRDLSDVYRVLFLDVELKIDGTGSCGCYSKLLKLALGQSHIKDSILEKEA